MQTAPPPTSADTPPPEPSDSPYGSPEVQRRNFWSWVLYQFFFRIGWQFKMESTLMAGLISYLAPSPAVMGLFTTLNTVGRNLAPLMAAPIVDRFQYKRGALHLFWLITVACWAALTIYLWLPVAENRRVSVWVFGVAYTLFFVFLGAASVAQGALLGKVVPPDVRGRAMAMGMTISGVINVASIWIIFKMMQGGRYPEPQNYALSFSLTVTFFLMAAGSLLLIRERPSEERRRPLSLMESLRHFVHLARGNPNLSRLIVVNLAVAIGGNMLPFYTGYWRRSGTLNESALMLATLFQVFWQCLACSLLGRSADRKGNRLMICGLMWLEAAIPLSALVLGGWSPFREHWAWYLGVYTGVGLRFPLYQFLVNYLLEIVPEQEHAMALGAVTTVQLLTAPGPILLGAIAAIWGYPVAFVLGSLVGVWGALAARGLEEVRVR